MSSPSVEVLIYGFVQRQKFKLWSNSFTRPLQCNIKIMARAGGVCYVKGAAGKLLLLS